MVFIREDIQGVDWYINKIQKRLEKSFDESVLSEIYGRCYLVEKEDSKLPYWYKGNNDYGVDILADDTKTRCFFIVEDRMNLTEVGQNATATVQAFFFMKLSETNERKDERLRLKALESFKTGLVQVTRLTKGVDHVMDYFSIKENDNIKWSDMHPYHVFSITSEINYEPKNKC